MSSGEEPQMILTFYSPSSRVHLDYICALCVLYLWISIVAFSRIKYLLPETEEACANMSFWFVIWSRVSISMLFVDGF